MRDYKKYDVWKQYHKFALKINDITKSFPTKEKFGIISQLKRVAFSVSTNITEGASRDTEKEFAYFINITSGSSIYWDFQNHLIICLTLIIKKT